MTKILNFGLKIKEGGREGDTCQVLRSCHPPKNLKRALGEGGIVIGKNCLHKKKC